MKRLIAFLAGLSLVAAACGAATTGVTTSVTSLTGEEESTTTPKETATVPTETTSTSLATTTATTSTTTSTQAPLEPTLPEGVPATFVGVTNDYEAVEVETATGIVLQSLGQMADAEELAAVEEEMMAFTIHIDQVWRTANGSWYLISECCEPAGGSIHRLRPGEALTRATHDDLPSQIGWHVTPLPTGSDVLVTGELGASLGPVGDEPRLVVDVSPVLPHGPAQWDAQRSVVLLLASVFGQSGRTGWVLVEATEGGVTSTKPLDWVDAGQYLSGFARHESGRLETVRMDRDGRGFPISDSAVHIAFQPNGKLIAEHLIEPGARLGGYDPSGRFLIYVDGDGTVRWRGEGHEGELARGYLFASW